ncbi:MAG: hypothetical protein P8Y44_07780 [Acidobacteriota bacterium]
MRKGLLVSTCFLLLCSLAVLLAAQGRPYRLQGLSGDSLEAADLSRGVHIVVIFASWSPRGKDVVDQSNQIHDRWSSQAKVILINFQEERSEVEAFLSGKSSKAAVYLDQDGSFSKRYSVTHLPGLLILKDGTAAFSGRLTKDSDAVISQTLG